MKKLIISTCMLGLLHAGVAKAQGKKIENETKNAKVFYLNEDAKKSSVVIMDTLIIASFGDNDNGDIVMPNHWFQSDSLKTKLVIDSVYLRNPGIFILKDSTRIIIRKKLN